MAVVAEVDSSTQSVKVTVCDAETFSLSGTGPHHTRTGRPVRPFEFSTLSWAVELWGFEPQTSCMLYTHDPSRVIARGRPKWI